MEQGKLGQRSGGAEEAGKKAEVRSFLKAPSFCPRSFAFRGFRLGKLFALCLGRLCMIGIGLTKKLISHAKSVNCIVNAD
ncbi:MAG: hypothetical protein BRC40_03595 [Cyanobacteria bacterium QH_8_48_120]|nr:MAG: hypothetical protein BRC40_03595 [Cyanobacteria bacterium QH_8_48_120]